MFSFTNKNVIGVSFVVLKCTAVKVNGKVRCYPKKLREAPWPSGRASDSGARGRGYDPQSGRRLVSLSKIHLPPKK